MDSYREQRRRRRVGAPDRPNPSHGYAWWARVTDFGTRDGPRSAVPRSRAPLGLDRDRVERVRSGLKELFHGMICRFFRLFGAVLGPGHDLGKGGARSPLVPGRWARAFARGPDQVVIGVAGKRGVRLHGADVVLYHMSINVRRDAF